MRVFLIGILCLLLGACSVDRGPAIGQQALHGVDARSDAAPFPTAAAAPVARRPIGIASLPDRGELLGYDRARGSATHGAYTWHPVQLSEAHAIRAIAQGELRLTAPDGRMIRLRYDHHVEHADGNWTWIGREPGAAPGTEAIITFGEKAVFGSIPDGANPPLRLLMAAGRTWLVATDPRIAARLQGVASHPRRPDFLIPPRLANRPANADATTAAAIAPMQGVMATSSNTVDLLLGYTSGFASRLGGKSGAVTRLTYLVDLANQALANSQVDARFRLVGTQQVSYADATANEDALYDLTGFQCTPVPSGLECEFVGAPAALQPLHDARNRLGADLVSLVRKFNDPENGGCGVAWLNGGGQVGISAADEDTGFSVVSDSGGSEFPEGSSICREESLAHELGHNMGSAHDRDTADGDDNVLQPDEYGRYPYSFGYKTGAGGLFTVMAYGNDGQTGYRVFSNPAISCGGVPCGIANQADNARSLRQTIPIIATFRATVATPGPSGAADTYSHFSGDFNGDGKSDILWRNTVDGRNTIWRSGNAATPQAVTTLNNLQWQPLGVGDYNGDGKADIFWRNTVDGRNTIWRSANSGTPQAVATLNNLRWKPLGTGDYNGSGVADIFWRNMVDGRNTIWLSANAATPLAVTTLNNMAWIPY